MGIHPNHPFLDGIFHYNHSLLGYPHDYGTPHITRVVQRTSARQWHAPYSSSSRPCHGITPCFWRNASVIQWSSMIQWSFHGLLLLLFLLLGFLEELRQLQSERDKLNTNNCACAEKKACCALYMLKSIEIHDIGIPRPPQLLHTNLHPTPWLQQEIHSTHQKHRKFSWHGFCWLFFAMGTVSPSRHSVSMHALAVPLLSFLLDTQKSGCHFGYPYMDYKWL